MSADSGAAQAADTSEQMRPGTMNQVAGARGHGIETQERNHNAPHYVWIALAPVFIGQRNQGATFLGDFPGEFLPAKTPVLIDPTRAFAPFELKALAVENTEAAFDRTLPEVDNHPNSYIAENSAYGLTKFVQKEYHDFGVAFFPDLVGADGLDVNELFSLIFNEGYFRELADTGQNVRTVEGVEFHGPFLDQVRHYLMTESGKIVGKVGITKAQKDLIQTVLTQLQVAINTAWDFSNGKLNATEQLIREKAAGKPGKVWYDMPDHRFPGSPPPLDLVCLAQTKRVPLDLKNLDASREMSQQVGDSVAQGIKEAFAGAGDAGKISLNDVKALLADQAKEYEVKLAALSKQVAGKKKGPEPPAEETGIDTGTKE